MAGQIGEVLKFVQGAQGEQGIGQGGIAPDPNVVDPTIGGLMQPQASNPGDPPPDAPSKNTIADQVGRYKELGGQVGGAPASANQRMVALQQYKDVSDMGGLGGLMSKMPSAQQPQMRQQNPMQINDFIKSLMR